MHRRTIVASLLVALVISGLVITPGTAQEAVPTVAVEPSTALVDGQPVAVRLSGFPAGEGVSVNTCVADDDDLSGCGSGFESVTVGADGSAVLQLSVDAIVGQSGGPVVDCRAAVDLCTVVAVSGAMGESPSTIVRAPLAFDPAGPILPAPVVWIEPADRLVDGQEVTLRGTGFEQGYAEVWQCTAGAITAAECARGGGQFVEGSDGELSSPVRLAATITTAADGPVDCRVPDACVLVVGRIGDPRNAEPVPLAFDPDAPVLPPPVLTADPAAGLVDGQSVTVVGDGFPPGGYVQLALCPADWSDRWVDCERRGRGGAEVDESGGFSERVMVRTRLRTGDGEVVDCRTAVTGCVLIADGEWATAVTTLAFDPDGPLRPTPVLTVEPATGLVDGQVVTVRGSGFLAGEGVSLAQCPELVAESSCSREYGSYVSADGDGSFETELAIRALVGFGEPTDCRPAPGTCVIVAVDEPDARARLDLDPGAPLLPPPVVEVEPTDALSDGDVVTVRGSGFRPFADVSIAHCGTDERAGCDEDRRYVEADQNGDLAASLVVYGDFEGWEGRVDCRTAPGACAIVVGDDRTGEELQSFPLEFGPPAPPRGRYLDRAFEVEVDRDVVYRTAVDVDGRTVDLALDLYRPKGDTVVGRPVVIWMHGGYFEFGDKASMEDEARDLASRGYVTASIQYRLRSRTEPAGISDALEDAEAAVAWFGDNAELYGVDERAISLGGFSAGGVTAHNIAYSPNAAEGGRSPVAAAISIAGVRTIGSPEAGEPPMLAFHGAEDTTVPYSAGVISCAEARAAGVTCELVTWEGVGHDQGSVRQVGDRTADFLAEQVLGPLGMLEGEAVADAGGPYSVVEGSTVELRATASVGPEGAPTTFTWSPAAGLDDPTSPTPVFTGVDDGEHPLLLQASGPRGTADAETTVSVVNAAPEIAEGSVELRAEDGRTGGRRGRGARLGQELRATFTDAGLDDTHVAQIDWGDGTTTTASVEPDPSRTAERLMTGDHRYRGPGTYTVTVTVGDDDGGADTWSGEVETGPTTGPPSDRPERDLLARLWELLQRLLRRWTAVPGWPRT